MKNFMVRMRIMRASLTTLFRLSVMMMVIMILGFVGSINSYAQLLNINSATLQGTACDENNASMVYSPDGTTLSVLFSEFLLDYPNLSGAPGGLSQVGELITPDVQSSSRKLVSAKFCNVNLNLTLGENIRIDQIKVHLDFRGGVDLDPGLFATFRSMLVYDVRTDRMTRTRKNLARTLWSEINQEWVVSVDDVVDVSLGCQKNSRSRVTLKSLLALSKIATLTDSQAQGVVSLDSADTRFEGIKISLVTSSCKK